MKKNPLLLLLLFSFAFVVSSCNKDDDPAPLPPVVGKWNLDRVLIANWPAPLAGANGFTLEPAALLNIGILDYGYIELNVRGDNNRFYRNARDGGFVDVSEGAWTFTNNELALKDDTATEERYTYDPVRGTLTGQPINLTRTLELNDGSTRQITGQVTYIFEKVD